MYKWKYLGMEMYLHSMWLCGICTKWKLNRGVFCRDVACRVSTKNLINNSVRLLSAFSLYPYTRAKDHIGCRLLMIWLLKKQLL